MSLELKELGEAIKADVESLRKTNNEALKLKADGKSVAEHEEKLAKINTRLDELDVKSKRLADIETALKRTTQGDDKTTEAALEKSIRKEFKRWLAKGTTTKGDGAWGEDLTDMFHKNGELKQSYFDAHPEIKALAVNDDTSGGFMVHADIGGRIIKRVFETSPIRQWANVQTISTDSLEGLIDADQTSYGWVAEAGARAQTTTPKIGQWRIPTHELYAQPAATQKLLDDAAWDPETWLANKVGDRFARAENAAFVSGTGAGQPFGFVTRITASSNNDGTSPTYDTYITDKKIGFTKTGVNGDFPAVPTTAAPTAQTNPLVNMMYSLKGQYREMKGTAWAMHRTMFGRVRTLQDALGRYVWEPGLGGQPSTLLNYPVAEFNDLAAFPSGGVATGTFGIWFANWPEFYQIVDRIGIRVLRDPYTAKPYILFYTTKRTGGDVLNYEAGKALQFSA